MQRHMYTPVWSHYTQQPTFGLSIKINVIDVILNDQLSINRLIMPIPNSDIVIVWLFDPNNGNRALEVCELHKCKRKSDVCDCKPPFKLFLTEALRGKRKKKKKEAGHLGSIF
ncbi:hypothetical protein NL108_013438 [Boleophthalmus pectinirostris]|nr:hypothetical protein NL108_013438 [Boleophthalmus pectinirostris]